MLPGLVLYSAKDGPRSFCMQADTLPTELALGWKLLYSLGVSICLGYIGLRGCGEKEVLVGAEGQ